jgi:hypothetical protein
MGAARYFIPSRLLLTLAACALAGCQPHHETETTEPMAEAPAPQELTWTEEPLGGIAGRGASPVPVKEGATPLVYLADRTQAVRVVDRTTGRVLGDVTVDARTIVRVDDRNGVLAGKQVLFAGPLEKGHRYAIVVVPPNENVTRFGRFTPVPQEEVEPEIQGESAGNSGEGGQ